MMTSRLLRALPALLASHRRVPVNASASRAHHRMGIARRAVGRVLATLLCALTLSAVLLTPAAAELRWGEPLIEAVPTPSPPQLTAPSYILVDKDSGFILAEHRPHEQWEPASLVKMMTAYVAFDELRAGHLSLEEKVLVSERAWRSTGSRMFIEVGDHVTLSALLQGLIVQSGNDAAVSIAEHVAGDEETFAQVMNQYANRLGMEQTHYANATGMPHPDMHTTAYDTARLARALIDDFPEYYEWYSQRSFEYGGIVQHNRNPLLRRDDTVDGLKTGYTRSAGYNLTASAERAGMRLIAVVLGTESNDARAEQTHQLLNYGFRFFETHRLYHAQEPITEVRTWKAKEESVALGLPRDLHITVPRREYENVTASIRLNDEIVAPLPAGEEVGQLKVVLAETVIHEAPLVTLNEVKSGGFLRRMVDDVRLRFLSP